MRLALRAVPVVLLLLSLSNLIRPRQAETVPLYAARTGLLCQSCHFDPNGGGPRNDFGFAFAHNRHSIEPEDSTSEFHDLDLTNRVGDRFPLYVGVNHRFMLLANSTAQSDSLDRFGFFNMENALHLTFQPHQRLTLVYTRDGFNSASRTQDAFGMIGFPGNGYFKAGRFRTPFGLRMDDHTVATRNSFLDFLDGRAFLPYDPREPDMGYEIGAERGIVFGRMSYTNGGTGPLTRSTNAQAVTAKLGYNLSFYQGAFSFYDDFHKVQGFDPFASAVFSDRVRFTRWGYYGLAHVGRLAFLGEVAAGTDRFNVATAPGTLEGRATNLLAGWVEADLALRRDLNVRARFDRLELDRASDSAIREANTHNRYALEGEYVPVPFAELRWTLRFIDHQDPTIDDERQAYLQMHFSY